MVISARNQLTGTVVSVKEGAVMAEVHVQLDGGQTITSVITMNAVQELGIAPNKPVTVVIKSTEVMLGVEHDD